MKEEPEVAEILASYVLPEQVCGKEIAADRLLAWKASHIFR